MFDLSIWIEVNQCRRVCCVEGQKEKERKNRSASTWCIYHVDIDKVVFMAMALEGHGYITAVEMICSKPVY
jgi:predicted GNAT family acetyltransferase